jgi:hypothetical protein
VDGSHNWTDIKSTESQIEIRIKTRGTAGQNSVMLFTPVALFSL